MEREKIAVLFNKINLTNALVKKKKLFIVHGSVMKPNLFPDKMGHLQRYIFKHSSTLKRDF